MIDINLSYIKSEKVLRNRTSFFTTMKENRLSYDVVSGSEITTCSEIDKPLVYRFTGNVMTFIKALCT